MASGAAGFGLAPWGTRAGRRRDEVGLTSVVGDSVRDIEEGTEASLGSPPRIEDAHLLRVWIDADVRAVHLADHQHAYRLIAAVAIPMGTPLAARQRDDI